MEYSAPYNFDEVARIYGRAVAERLNADPAHAWRMRTGLELVHPEPTLAEQERIYRNWCLMTPGQKRESDKESVRLFGMGNAAHHRKIMREKWRKDIGE